MKVLARQCGACREVVAEAGAGRRSCRATDETAAPQASRATAAHGRAQTVDSSDEYRDGGYIRHVVEALAMIIDAAGPLPMPVAYREGQEITSAKIGLFTTPTSQLLRHPRPTPTHLDQYGGY